MDQTQLVHSLQQSLSANPSDIKSAESQLTQSENQNAGQLLMQLLGLVFSDGQLIPIRQSASIFSKNLLRRRWMSSQDDSVQHLVLDDSSKERVRALLLDATCGPSAVPLPRQIQSQVNAIISFIADIDFPKAWPHLLPSLVQTLNSSPSNELRLNALTCLCSVFKKYNTVSRSTEVLLELKYLLPLFQATHLSLFTSVLPAILSNPRETPKEVFSAMEQILDIFYSLNVVDIPEFYQDNIQTWMSGHMQILALPHGKSPADEPGPIEIIKALACDNLALYADKYQEPFEPFVIDSVKGVWSLLVGLDCNESRFDQLVASGIKFLSSTANTRWAQSPFDNQEALVQMCEKLILPNIQLRDVDVELFADNPDDYIRKDLENADAGTRRRTAIDLVRALSKFHEDQITTIITHYIENLLKNFASNFRAKDACIQLVTSVAAKGETRAAGVSLVNPKVDIHQFFSNQILPELLSMGQKCEEDRAVFRASCIKFLILFRNQLDKGIINQAIPGVLGMINMSSPKVVQCYAANCGFLLMSVAGINPVSEQLATAVVDNALQIIISTVEQNDHLIKLVYRLKSNSPSLIPKLMALVSNFSKNPVNAVFTHYMFEALGTVVAASPRDSTVINPLCLLLEKNVMEYIPYALQILALLIESASSVQEVFGQLFTLLLNDSLWKSPSLIPGIVRIMMAYVYRSDLYGSIVVNNLHTVVARFQMLLGTAKFEKTAFDLLNSVTTSKISVSPEALKLIFISILTKIHSKRTERLVREFAISLSCMVASPSISLEAIVAVLDEIQPGLSTQVIKDLWMNAIGNMNINTVLPKARKVVLIALSKLFTNLVVTSNPTVAESVLSATQYLLCLNPAKALGGEKTIIPTETAVSTEDSMEFEVSYAKLSSTVNMAIENDYLPEISLDGATQLKQVLRTVAGLQSVPQLAAWVAS